MICALGLGRVVQLRGRVVADVFISYSKQDRAIAEALASRLTNTGHSVWWDTNLVGGDQFRQVIVEELNAAKSVIVVWTPNSVKSEWVASEAQRAAAQKKLVPVKLPGLPVHDIPPPFDTYHMVDLAAWPEVMKAVDEARSNTNAPDSIAQNEYVQSLISEAIISRGIPTNKRSPHQFEIITRQLMESKMPDISERRNWHKVANERLEQILAMLEYFASISNSKMWCEEADAHKIWKQQNPLWRHRELSRAFGEGTESTEAADLEREALSQIAEEYLREGVRSPEFERILVDALLATEIYKYGEAIKKNPSRFESRFSLDPFERDMKESKRYLDAKGDIQKIGFTRLREWSEGALTKFFLLIVFPISGIWYGAIRSIDSLTVLSAIALALVVGFYVVRGCWRFIQRLFGRKKTAIEAAVNLHGKMVDAYNELRGPTTSPTRIRELLSRVAAEGAVWDPSVFAVLDIAIQRSPGSWV